MGATILIGRAEKLERVPDRAYREELGLAPRFFAERLAFMTAEHHRVRNFVVAELPRAGGRPLEPEEIARSLGIEPFRLEAILGELEKNLFFLVRDDAGAVSWAFPVTSVKTPHRARFSSGESSFTA